MKTIENALHNAAVCSAIRALEGLPTGGWPETQQALRQVSDALPVRSARDYAVRDLLARTVDSAGSHYRVMAGVLQA